MYCGYALKRIELVFGVSITTEYSYCHFVLDEGPYISQWWGAGLGKFSAGLLLLIIYSFESRSAF